MPPRSRYGPVGSGGCDCLGNACPTGECADAVSDKPHSPWDARVGGRQRARSERHFGARSLRSSVEATWSLASPSGWLASVNEPGGGCQWRSSACER